MMKFIRKFSEIGISDLPVVGGKNSSLGEMYSQLASKGIRIPDGFATTSEAFSLFLSANNLGVPLRTLMNELDRKTWSNLKDIGAKARALLLAASLPEELVSEISTAYSILCGEKDADVAVRSSATAEDLPDASFAGQHESFLNVNGAASMVEAVKKCFASLYTDRAIKYREDKGFDHEKVLLSVGVQKMVRSDLASSGVCFTLDPESGFRDVIHLSGVWGLGENIVQGTVTPDEFLVFKPTLREEKNALIRKKLGEKEQTMIYSNEQGSPVKNIPTADENKKQFVLNDDEILQLAKWALIIEEHYGKPMDIEWAKDGNTKELFIIQARPETVHAHKNPLKLKEFNIRSKGELLSRGQAIGTRVAVGIARKLNSPAESEKLQPGEIVITDLTSPDWDPVLKKSAAIITNKGGRTSHASIVARELGVPAVVGCGDATEKIRDGELITVSCCEGSQGYIYRGKADYEEKDLDLSRVKMPERTEMMLIVADPDKAFKLSFYPNNGVGLMRIEFIITHFVRIHPMALVKYDQLQDPDAKSQIEAITSQYPDKEKYFVDQLAMGVATIAAAFYPRPVIVRMSDFKTNEYANLLGGKEFEPEEENPMIGFRGASRYYHDLYREGFRLECEAIRKVRDEMGLVNVKVMIPFCRTLEEGRRVIDAIGQYGLKQGKKGLEVYVMAEIPSNVILASKFAKIFDGFSIGSNDLTQLTLGIDRDSAIISNLFSEQNEAPKEMIATMIARAREAGKKIGLCGQAPSDFPEYAQFLVEQGIDSISFNPDSLLNGIENTRLAEEKMKALV